MTEADFQAMVIEACKLHQVANFHVHDSRRSNPGFPDLVLVGQRVIYRELKTATGRLSVHQVYWLDLLTSAGEDAAVWRPEDWPDRILAEIRSLGRATAPPVRIPKKIRATRK